VNPPGGSPNVKIEHPLVTKSAGLLGMTLLRQWMGTLDFKLALYDPTVDPSFATCRQRKIYVFWHEYLLFPLYLYGHCNVAMLLSRHRDAHVLGWMAQYLGFAAVRGSTNRGGAAAVRELIEVGRQMHLTITPDGPRGPRRQLALGSIYLASKTGLPVVTIGLGYDRPWRLNSWDRFAIPRPFSRARQIFGPETHVPRGLDRQGLEHYRAKIERLLDGLTEEAEGWALSGSRRLGQMTKTPRPRRLPIRHAIEPGLPPDSLETMVRRRKERRSAA
jgi:lysophospholipid acyltransferase (LPLAT)-like uncharacterized protein